MGSRFDTLWTMSSSGPVFQNSVYVGINLQDILYGELRCQCWTCSRSHLFARSQASS